MQFINSPTGPKTTHFWGPVANWGFVLAVCDGSGWEEREGRKAGKVEEGGW